ncbi:FKBP-type peptidyl-prolyl cis-trans isomerase FklB [Leeuwenhoekiella aestuarii]|uniref:Peptidyl-prolyl cis-trans isomerase n=1 Tax=Leeuwenhoekiella aestuarii TaxID=2249426 RepID=A0A4V1KPT8_9FLAO|nr:FKBP-type peptidyl-prolyl cis-trans isomerase [Leeuwenhoekiella aestuarii]RXG17842.1 FKBP-type peptidyl-prolyl cis-trans isomerase FklB [Leeuwenhoekiella aestuarii]RXG19171.1 FKBP-type peptidyl-prolyl cis-trans isomerase FklB [Leeuwenhoekiella aestuarii]
MKLNRLFLALPVALTLVNCNNSKMNSGGDAELKTFKDSVSYIIGANTGAQFKQALGDNPDEFFDVDVYEQGVRKALTDSVEMPQQVMQQVMQKFQMQLREKQQKEQEAKAADNKKKEEAFLKENATKDGVQTTESGLQYKVIEEGSGDSPSETDKVEVNYEGKLLDGTVFDSSYDRGESTTFGVNQVIKGWTEGLQLMKEGAKYEFYIPSELAYGQRGSGAKIGPGEPLIFIVELIDVKGSE